MLTDHTEELVSLDLALPKECMYTDKCGATLTKTLVIPRELFQQDVLKYYIQTWLDQNFFELSTLQFYTFHPARYVEYINTCSEGVYLFEEDGVLWVEVCYSEKKYPFQSKGAL